MTSEEEVRARFVVDKVEEGIYELVNALMIDEEERLKLIIHGSIFLGKIEVSDDMTLLRVYSTMYRIKNPVLVCLNDFYEDENLLTGQQCALYKRKVTEASNSIISLVYNQILKMRDISDAESEVLKEDVILSLNSTRKLVDILKNKVIRKWDKISDIKKCLKEGADVNIVTDEGNTLLMTYMYDEDIGRILLDAEADINAVNAKTGETVLMVAADVKKRLCLELMKRGADVNALNPQTGESVLMVASKTGLIDECEKMIEKGADVNALNPQTGDTALMVAVRGRSVMTCSILIAGGAKVDARVLEVASKQPPYYAKLLLNVLQKKDLK